jgi:hypothetical protein
MFLFIKRVRDDEEEEMRNKPTMGSIRTGANCVTIVDKHLTAIADTFGDLSSN